ncbi:hypothetical protein ES708_28214 [subsurface metagenome]
MSKMVEVQIKITAPYGAPEGEVEKVADMIVKLAEIIAEVQGAPKPEVRRITHEQADKAPG